MLELISTEKKFHAGTNLLVVSLGYRHFSFSVVSLISLHSHIKLSCIHLSTVALRQTSSPVPVISKKQFEKEEKKLIKEIQLTTEETNELRDRLIYVTEGSMNKRYTLLQNLWCQSGVCNASLILCF